MLLAKGHLFMFCAVRDYLSLVVFTAAAFCDPSFPPQTGQLNFAWKLSEDLDGTSYCCMHRTSMEWTPDADDTTQGTCRQPQEIQTLPPGTLLR